ncbi:MAG TPA: DUF58 domain-containing protein [Anaerolineae bacterium]|nr:DUF58 domain-containing protein [Anaerolineae bacterium]
MLFDEVSLRKLQQLTLVTSRVRAGALRGERRSLKRGAGLEFADFRDYVPGDDLRRVDWNVYARLDRPYVKLREEEEDLAVHILVDASQSMDWGEDAQHKFNYALHLAAGLGLIGLSTGDRVTVSALKTSEVARTGGSPETSEISLRGQQYLMQLLKFLEAQRTAGMTDLEATARRYLIKPRRSGLVILISDLLSPNGYQSTVKLLQQRGHEVAIVHVMSPDEIDPPLAGDLKLIDVETGGAQEVSIDGGLRDAYRERVKAWRHEAQTFCRIRGVRYLAVQTDRPWDEVVLHDMRKAGMVK